MTSRYMRAAYPLSSQSLTGYFRPDYTSGGVHPGAAGDNWPGSASAGTSATRTLVSEGATNVTLGTSLNGHVSAHLVSTAPSSAYFHAGALGVGKMSDLFSSTAFSFGFVVDPTTAIYAGTGGRGYLARDHNAAFFGLSYLSVGLHSGGAPVVQLHAFNATTQIIAERIYTVGSGHVPHIITGRLRSGRLEVGVNEVPGAQGGFSSVAYTGAIPTSGMNDTMDIGFFGGSGFTGNVWQPWFRNDGASDHDFEDAVLHARVEYAQGFLP